MHLNTIMKWFIIVLMMGAYADGTKDMFWYDKPEFNTVEECQLYVTFNADSIKMNMAGQDGTKQIEMGYCGGEDHLEEFGVPEKV